VPAKKPWPPETIARLRAAWESGVSATRIGAELGFTKNAIIGKARRLHLSPRDTRFAAEIATKIETEEERDTIRRLWRTHSVSHIKAVTGIGWRRLLRVAESLGLPPKATVIIERNRASPPRGAKVSGAQVRTSRSKRAAKTSAAPPSARGGRTVCPTSGITLPGVAPETLMQRRVFSGKLCKAVIGGERRAVQFCDQPVIASAKGQHCASPYCLQHYAAAYIGTNRDMGEPNKLRFRP
jgi:hypothetical protein